MEWEKAFVQTVSDNAVPPKSSFTVTLVMMMIKSNPSNTERNNLVLVIVPVFECF